MVLVLVACSTEDIKSVPKKKTNFASQIIFNAHILQRDSGNVNLVFKSPLIEKYEFLAEPYIELRKGLYLEFYTKAKPKVPGKLWANYAKIIESKGFYYARGNVKVINPEGQTFKMQSVYWNKTTKKMYTKDTVYISDTEGSSFQANNGMIAKDDFSEYVFMNNSGNFSSKNLKTSSK